MEVELRRRRRPEKISKGGLVYISVRLVAHDKVQTAEAVRDDPVMPRTVFDLASSVVLLEFMTETLEIIWSDEGAKLDLMASNEGSLFCDLNLDVESFA
jgi:hypothetical protein